MQIQSKLCLALHQQLLSQRTTKHMKKAYTLKITLRGYDFDLCQNTALQEISIRSETRSI